MSVAGSAGAVGTAAALGSRRRGWYLYGWASHVFPTLITTVFMSRYLGSVAEHDVGRHGRVHVLGIPIAPQSLFVYTVSACTVLVVVLMPVVGAFADRTGRKRDILCGFGAVGAVACLFMFFVRGGNWPAGAALYAVAFVAYSCAAVVNYALLIDLSGPADRDRISSMGWGFSYLGGGLLLGASFVVSLFLHDDALLARLAMGASGIWWLVFMLPTLRRLPKRMQTSAERPDAGGSTLSEGFRQLGRTLRSLRAFPLTLLFLAAFLIYNDGIQTVTTVAAQYGQFELDLSQSTLLSSILIVQFVAFAGAVWLGRLAERFGAKRVVLGSLVVWVVIIAAAYAVQRGEAWQFYLLAVAIAVVLGGSQALSRSMFSRLIPAGREAEYFGFYEISDSGTSWLGPLIFGLTLQNTGSYRSALASLLAFFVVGFIVLAFVPFRRAIVAAGNVPGDRVTTPPGALAAVPAAGRRRALPMSAQLTFFYGPMDCGKSTLALQIDHNHARQGRRGLVLTRYDRSGRPEVTTRVGLSHVAVEIEDDTDLRLVVRAEWAAGRPLDYLIVDEAGFLTRDHVDQLAELVDDAHVDVYCFGLATDFRSVLLPGAQRLVELADVLSPVQVDVLCWCGRTGRLNARLVDGVMVREGDTVVVADTASAGDLTVGLAPHPAVRYQVLCRAHYRHGDLGPPSDDGQGQLDFGS